MDVHYSQFQQQQQQLRMASALAASGVGVPAADQTATTLFPQMIGAPPQVISEPVSGLTCNVSGSRKRAREDEPHMQPATATAGLTVQKYQQRLMLQNQYQQRLLQNQIQLGNTHPDGPVDNSRLNESIMTSTTGRHTTPYIQNQYSDSVFPGYGNKINTRNITSTAASTDLSSSPSTGGLLSLLNQQSLEVDDLVHQHTDKLRSALVDARKSQCRAMLSVVAQHAQGRIAEKHAEVEAAEKRNAELQRQLRQALVESQAWFNVARNNEAVVASLRDSLEQVLMQNLNGGEDRDSEEEADASAAASSAVGIPTVADLQEKPSASSKADGIRYSPCKSCGASDGCVLVLPCRHLCLCQSCEPAVDECPLCRCRKNGSVPINLT